MCRKVKRAREPRNEPAYCEGRQVFHTKIAIFQKKMLFHHLFWHLGAAI